MKTILGIITIAALSSFTSCTYTEAPPPDAVTSHTRDTTTTATDLSTGESVTTRQRTTHYPANE
jgi:hypothetical protein